VEHHATVPGRAQPELNGPARLRRAAAHQREVLAEEAEAPRRPDAGAVCENPTPEQEASEALRGARQRGRVAQAGDPMAGPLAVDERAQLALVLARLCRWSKDEADDCHCDPTHARQDPPPR
jgi:hypothetical protein